MLSRRFRIGAVLGLYVVTGISWFTTFPVEIEDLELVDVVVGALALGFAVAIELVLFTLDLPTLELGWGIFTYALLVRLLDELAEAPDIYEATVPEALRLVGLGIVLLGFVRARTRLRSDLAERNERLSVLNRILRHNLRNGLTTITTALEHFGERAATEDDAEYARMGLEQARNLHEVSEKAREIDQLLEAAETTGKRTYDLVLVVESAVEQVRSEYPDVEFEVTTPAKMTVTAVEGIESAIRDVIENACEHNDAADPVVAVTVREDGGYGSVTVTDNGSGIRSSELAPLRTGEESKLAHGSGTDSGWFGGSSGNPAGTSPSPTTGARRSPSVFQRRTGSGIDSGRVSPTGWTVVAFAAKPG